MSADVAQDPPQLEPHPQALNPLAQRGESLALTPFPKSLTEPHLPLLLQAPPPSFPLVASSGEHQVGAESQGQPGHHHMKISIPCLNVKTGKI